MKCRNCSYGKEDSNRRMYWYNKTVQEYGIPNDIYHNLQPEDAANEFEQFLWFDKVGGKVYCFYHCEDAYSEENAQEHHSKKKEKKQAGA